MKIQKSRLEQIVKEEVLRHVRSIVEGPDVADAHTDKKEKEDAGEKDPQTSQNDPENGASPKTPLKKNPGPDDNANDQPEAEDPADDDLEKDAEEDPDEKEQDAKKKLSDELTGKSIQSITQEPKSKTLPGAQEIVLTFDNSTEPLRILVTKSGQVKFFFNGALHNEV